MCCLAAGQTAQLRAESSSGSLAWSCLFLSYLSVSVVYIYLAAASCYYDMKRQAGGWVWLNMSRVIINMEIGEQLLRRCPKKQKRIFRVRVKGYRSTAFLYLNELNTEHNFRANLLSCSNNLTNGQHLDFV